MIMQDQPLQRAARHSVLITGASGILLAYLAFLALTTAYSADDFWYSTFWDNGLRAYIRLMVEHYRDFNGRVLVHLFAHVILHFGNWLFALVLPAVMLVMPLLAEGESRRTGDATVAVLAFLVGVTALPRILTAQGITWISAFCNYVLPSVFILGQLQCMTWFVRQGTPLCALGCCVISFLCGATTEQSGMVAAYVTVYAAICCLPRQVKRLPVCLMSLLCVVAGLLTIFASPATRARISTEGASGEALGLLSNLLKGAEKQSALFFQSRTFLPFLLLLLLAGVVFLYRQGQKSLTAGGGAMALLGAACLLMGAVSPRWELLAYIGLQLCLFALGVVLWLGGRRQLCALICCGLVSLVVLLPTSSNEPRTMLPYALYMLLTLAWLAAELLPGGRRSWLILLPVFAVVAVYAAAQLPGYWHNAQIERLNRAYVRQAQDTRVLYYCMDYDRAYTHTKAHETGYFYVTYLAAAGMDPHVDTVYVYSDHLPKLYVNGRRLTSPAVPAPSGELQLPYWEVIASLGGAVADEPNVWMELNGRSCRVDYGWDDMNVIWKDDSGQEHRQLAEQVPNYYAKCLPQWAYTEIWGLEVRAVPDGDSGRLEISMPRQ